jgi:hypothetical protein
VARADEAVGNSGQVGADTNRAPGVAEVVEMEGPDPTAGIRLAGRRRAVVEVIVDKSPATKALPAALRLREGGASVEGLQNLY